MTTTFCTECGEQFAAIEKFCTQCGNSRGPGTEKPSFLDSDGPTNLSMPDGLPPIDLTIYDGPAKAEAISLINALSSQQRKVWVLAGQPDILLWPGGDFSSWMGAVAPDFYQQAKAAEANLTQTSTAAMYPNARPTNGLAVAGFVLSLVSIFGFQTVIPGILGLVFSISGITRASTLERASGIAAGRGLAIAGLIISGLSLFGTLIWWAEISSY